MKEMEKIPVRKLGDAPIEPVLAGSFGIRRICDLLEGRDMVQNLHRHDFYYILVLERGMGEHEIDFISYEINGNSIFFMRPGQVHKLLLKADSTGYLMQFDPDYYYPHDKAAIQLLRKTSSTNFYRLSDEKFRKFLDVLSKIFNENTDRSDGFQEVIKANLSIFFIELLRQGTITKNSTNYYAFDRLKEFLELLETNIAVHKQTLFYADTLSLSPYQLNAITKTTMGKTCSDLINEHIILEAKRYLLATSNQVNQIAYHLGYQDVSYFIRFFKKHTGHSPEVYRQNFRKVL